jgi:hypothetical protein
MRPVVRFVYAYIVRLGFLDGRPGLVFCSLLAFYDFLSWANVYEASLKRQDQPPLGPNQVGSTVNPTPAIPRPLSRPLTVSNATVRLASPES